MNRLHSSLHVALVLLLVSTGFHNAKAQKVKYKDLFALLNTKQYEQAEPFLKRFLQENSKDNPNALLYMGIIFHEKALKEDVLKQTDQTLAHLDSAILFYTKAYQTINEREIKSNKDYYVAYNRRDLRTGEFGVKLSDVHYDIEKKMESVRERIEKIKLAKTLFISSERLYERSQNLYTALQQQYPTEKKLLLRANDKTLKSLNELTACFDSCMKSVDSYRVSIQGVGGTRYNQSFKSLEIKSYENDGRDKADFHSNEIRLWDYKGFAQRTKTSIENDIIPMRKHLVSYDVEINKLREKLEKDSISVKNELLKLVDALLYEKIQRHDKDPLPMHIFSIKIADLEYRSSIVEKRRHRDSTSVILRFNDVKEQLRYLAKLDSVARRFNMATLEEEGENYSHFITNTFSSISVLKNYLSSLREYTEREKALKQRQFELAQEGLLWVIDGKDSIPLINSMVKSRYKPLHITENKYTAGLYYKDSLTVSGYFRTITPSRKPDVKIDFQVDKAAYRLSKLPKAKSLLYNDPNGQLFFVCIYSEDKVKDKYPVTISKIYRSDGLAWNSNYQLPFIPSEISFNAQNGELVLQTLDQRAVFDKNGKLK